MPSLPGYGFSFAPGQRRFGIVDCADAIHALMTDVLGHERYLVVGGDWGSSIAVPARVRVPGRRRGAAPVHDAAAPARDLAGVARPTSREALEALVAARRAATSHIQGTRPQTLAYGLTDSPVGLCGWLAEKFERLDRRARLDPDDVLAMVTIYWVTGTIGSSFWPYYARLHGEWVLDDVVAAGGRIARAADVPRLPEGARPRAAHGRRARVRRSSAGRRPTHGGHFPALEQTDVLADSAAALPV